MKRDILKIALVSSLVFNAAVIGAFAYGLMRRPAVPEFCPEALVPHQRPPEWHGTRLARRIGVPHERTPRFIGVMSDTSRETAAVRGALRRSRDELMALIEAGDPDEAAIMAKVDEISRLQGDYEKRVVARLLDAGSVLTSEERARFMRLIRHRCMSRDTVTCFTPAGQQEEREVP